MMSEPRSRTWSRYMALTVPAVPTGMKAGVRTVPRGIETSPRRALPSVARSLKEKTSVMVGPEKQARVAIGIEAIAVCDGVGIGRAHALQPGECGDQHEERRSRQMEIGHQRIGDAEAMARRDEDVGRDRTSRQPLDLACCIFEQPERRRYATDDTVAPRP